MLNCEKRAVRVFLPMRRLVLFFVLALPLCIYPVFLRVPIEITSVFGLVEVDMFSWYRMWLVAICGIALNTCLAKEVSTTAYVYCALLWISFLFSSYFRTAVFGAPWTHEGAFAIMAYSGLYFAGKEYGLFKGLEKALDIVVIISFLGCLLQFIYGSPILFPPIKYFFPAFQYETSRFPFYSVYGSGNHLGLFCALFFPYVLVRKKYGLALLVLIMAIGSESRAAWLSMLITTSFCRRRVLLIAAFASAVLFIPFNKQVISRVVSTVHDIHIPMKDSDLDGRAHVWRKMIPQLKRTILIGEGPGNFAMYFPQHRFFGSHVVDRPHNIYLNIWVSTGLISLLMLLACVLVTLLLSTDLAMQLGAIGFLVAGLFTDSVLSVTPYFIIFLGCLSHEDDWRVL